MQRHSAARAPRSARWRHAEDRRVAWPQASRRPRLPRLGLPRALGCARGALPGCCERPPLTPRHRSARCPCREAARLRCRGAPEAVGCCASSTDGPPPVPASAVGERVALQRGRAWSGTRRRRATTSSGKARSGCCERGECLSDERMVLWHGETPATYRPGAPPTEAPVCQTAVRRRRENMPSRPRSARMPAGALGVVSQPQPPWTTSGSPESTGSESLS